MKKIIVNADDFGYSKGVNLGIIDAFLNGMVTSTTLMTNMFAFDHAVSLAKMYPDLGVGVHLTLTAQKPLLQTHRSIVDEKGAFYTRKELIKRIKTVDLNEIYDEFNAQIKKAIDAGIKVTHLDSHHHIAYEERILPVLFKLAKQYHLPIRMPGKELIKEATEAGMHFPMQFCDQFYGDHANIQELQTILYQFMSDSKLESLEVMCHPAFLDQTLYIDSAYSLNRMRELDVLTSPELMDFVENENLNLTNYLALRKQG